MKKIYFLIAGLLISLVIQAERLSQTEVLKQANNFLAKKQTKGALLKEESLKAHIYDNDTCFYSIEKTNGGWLLISNDSRTVPVLAYSDNSTFPTTEEMPDGMRFMLDWYAEVIQNDSTPNYVSTISEEATDSVLPLLGGVNWNQSGNNLPTNNSIEYAYNKFCPIASGGPNGHAYVGCTAVAMGQIMHYWEWPNFAYIPDTLGWNGTLYSSHLATFQWNHMPDNIYEDRTPISEVNNVASFLKDCGYSIEMQYSDTGSSASVSLLKNVLIYFYNYDNNLSLKYQSNYQQNWNELIKNELRERRPVYYTGYYYVNEQTRKSSGHSFVVDGFDTNNLFHINWGWGGSQNGYFTLLPAVYVYTHSFSAIVGIKPAPQCTSEDINVSTIYSGEEYSIESVDEIQTDVYIETQSTVTIISEEKVTLQQGFSVEPCAKVYIDIRDIPCEENNENVEQ